MIPDNLPRWALTPATSDERLRAIEAHGANLARIEWGDLAALRAWARQRGWPAPRLFFERAFRKKLFESDEYFADAVTNSGITILVPHTQYRISQEHLNELDEAYRERSYRWLVEALREIRRAVEAGVVVEVEERRLKSFDSFYEWAHGRYYALEDDPNTGWIGDDGRHR